MNLKKLRENQGLTQNDVAEIMGYESPQLVSNNERGVSMPPLKSLKKLADLYKTDFNMLADFVIEETLRRKKVSMKKKIYGRSK